MKIWTVANQKGGVGKTTTSVTLGGLISAWGFRTLLVDLDPHGSLTSYFRYDPEMLDESVYNLFKQVAEGGSKDPRPFIRPTGVEGLDLLPAATALATLERQSGMRGGMGLALARSLATIKDEYDYVLIDCPPMLGVLMINALAASEHLIIPVQTEFLALKGLERMVHTLDMVHKSRPRELPYTVLPTMYDQRTRASIDTLRTLRDQYSEHLWRSVIPVDTQFREASRVGTPPSIYAPSGRGVRAYEALLRDLRGERSADAVVA